MDPWEATLVLNLRRWCEGPRGQDAVLATYENALPRDHALHECEAFETLIQRLLANAHRPLVRHQVSCACLGADEGVFVQLVRWASDGHLNDAAMLATLMVGPGHAEHIALLAAQVGCCARRLGASEPVVRAIH